MGAEKFSELVDQAQPLSEFFFDHFTQMVDMSALDGRARLVELARPELEKLPEGVFREMMVEKLESLAGHRIGSGKPSFREERKGPVRPRQGNQRRTPMRLALAHLVQQPSKAGAIDPQRLEGNELPGMNILLELVEFCRQRPHMTTAQLLELWREHEAHTHLHTLATWDLPGEDEKQVREFSDAITSLELIWLDTKLGTMPRISDQSGEQRREFVALQKEREQLKAILAGRMGSQRVQK